MTLLNQAMERLRKEYPEQAKMCRSDTLQPLLDPINCKRLSSYAEVAEELDASLSEVKTLVHRLRKRYSGLLREEVFRTVTDEQAVDEEIHGLCDVLP
jgi:hypothetical protein